MTYNICKPKSEILVRRGFWRAQEALLSPPKGVLPEDSFSDVSEVQGCSRSEVDTKGSDDRRERERVSSRTEERLWQDSI